MRKQSRVSSTVVKSKRLGRAMNQFTLEQLEQRQLLSAGNNVFAELQGAIANAGESFAINFELKAKDFKLVGGRLTLGFLMEPAEGSSIDGGRITIATRGSGNVRGVTQSNSSAIPNSSVLTASLAPGKYSLTVKGDNSTTGNFVVDTYLPGDLNGDRQVTAAEATAVAQAVGKTTGQAGYSLEADANLDGRIARADANAAKANSGGSTKVNPLSLAFSLSAASDPNANGQIITPDATFTCATSAGARVNVDGTGDGVTDQSILTPAGGNCGLTHAVSYGTTPITATATDSFGQRASVSIPVTRHDIVLDWNANLLSAIRTAKTNPPAASRFMAMVQTSVYNAVNTIIPTAAPYKLTLTAPTGASAEAAAAAAAHKVLNTIYPAQVATFDAALTASLAEIPDSQGKTDGVTFGESVADQIIALRANDGFNATTTFVPSTLPGDWQPTPPAFAPPLLPEWGKVTPWAMTTGDQFSIPIPSDLTSAQYTAEFNFIKTIGKSDSLVRTPDQTAIAKFWANGGGTSTPPGHWNVVSEVVAKQMNNNLVQNARLFAMLGVAVADAAIATWQRKYDHSFWRPVTAIRAGDADNNPDTVADPNWLPLITTPPFPAYSSGHAAFSKASADVLAAFYGTDNITFTLKSEDATVADRTFLSFSKAAQESADSRGFGGIHWTFDDQNGLAIGDQVGQLVAANFFTPNT